MPELFAKNSFAGGLNAQFARVNTPADAYPLLFNGRSQQGTISPVKKHVRQEGLPAGVYQSLVALGDYVLVMVSGMAYFKNVVSFGDIWRPVPGFSALNATATEIYVELFPVGTSRMNYVSGAFVFNAGIVATPQCLRVSDNINQARLIYLDGTNVIAQTYAQWSKSNPQYMPVGAFACLSGVRGFMASQDKTRIYATRSGRPLDYVINLTSSGEKGGDASTTETAVDFNPLTALIPSSEGGIIATTLNATYNIFLDAGNIIFGEATPKSTLLFPVGCVNYKSFCDLGGDSAFITQAGIQSFNITAQTQRESNNFPLGARIARYLVAPQKDTAAINFDTLALFAVNTVFGEVVLVYDTTTQQFVSVDTGFGKVRQFAVHRSRAAVRLWFINESNELWEAYASEDYEQCSVLVGDYALTGPTMGHVVSDVFASFVNLREKVDVRVTLYGDEVLITSGDYSIGDDSIIEPPTPIAKPFTNQQKSEPVVMSVAGRRQVSCTSVWLQWTGYAELASLSVSGEPALIGRVCVPVNADDVQKIVFLGNMPLNGSEVTAAAMSAVSGLVVGNDYFADGSVNTGAELVTNSVFKAIGTTAYATARVSNVTNEVAFKALIRSQAADYTLVLGDVLQPAATEADYQRFKNFWLPAVVPNGLIGAIENATAVWFGRNQRYYPIYGAHVSLFLFNAYDIDGISATSVQGFALIAKLALSTARFNVLVINKPLYSDTTIGDNASLAWLLPYFDMVICGGAARYERFYRDGVVVVNASSLGTTPLSLVRTQTSLFTSTAPGYLVLNVDLFGLNAKFLGANNTLIDEFSL